MTLDDLEKDRKFNVIIYGVEKCCSRLQRDMKESSKINSIHSSLEDSLSESCVKDHFRLGKFNKKATRPRPILLKLHRTVHVRMILANRSKLKDPLKVRQDL